MLLLAAAVLLPLRAAGEAVTIFFANKATAPVSLVWNGRWMQDIQPGGIVGHASNAGAEWVDAPVVVDRYHVTSRRPGDLPEFCRAILSFLRGE